MYFGAFYDPKTIQMVSLKDVAIERNRSSLDEPLGSDSQPQGPQNSRRHLLETSEAKGCDQSPGQHQDLNRLAATSSVRSAERIDMVTVEKGKARAAILKAITTDRSWRRRSSTKGAQHDDECGNATE